MTSSRISVLATLATATLALLTAIVAPDNGSVRCRQGTATVSHRYAQNL